MAAGHVHHFDAMPARPLTLHADLMVEQRPRQSPEAAGPGRYYEIRVRGAIGPTMLQAFPTLSSDRREDDTLLHGELRDEGALYGVIHQLETLGLELLALKRVS